MKKTHAQIRPRFRILSGQDIALGPGKVELLERIHQTGSIGDAAKQMDMSYMRAWLLIQTMNACFTEPLVTTARGGKRGGGATLTTTGKTVLKLYRDLEKASLRATRPAWQKLRKFMR